MPTKLFEKKNEKNSTKINGKDVSLQPETFLNHINGLKKQEISPNLRIILDTAESLKKIKTTDIKFSAPVLFQGENAVIFPHTINVIQGQNGVHKSRLAENICSALLKKNDCNNELLGFRRAEIETNYSTIYVDTERNLSEQLPYALQSIQIKAGYKKSENPENFYYVSLLQIARTERFKVLDEYLNYIRQSTNNPLFIVLDVSTDCIEDFNKVDKSLELIDLMNIAINEHNLIFLCLIHENPNSIKGRGHFGTELMNKASTVMQVGFEKDANQNDTDIIRVKYLKCRSTARHTPFHVKYSDEAKGLILADIGEISAIVKKRVQKAPIEEVIEFLEMYLGDGTRMSRTELLGKLRKDFDAGQRTIEERISEIINSETEIYNINGNHCKLNKEISGKIIYYSLIHNGKQ